MTVTTPITAASSTTETIAATGVRPRGFMIDLLAHIGLEKISAGYERLLRILEASKIIIG